MWQYTCNYQDTLCHHGIKGQKWGVRRFQNEDGSYTKRGLARYNESTEKYSQAESNYKKAKRSGDKQAIRTAKTALKSAKKQVNRDYNRLKLDSKADKGKELYKSGETVTSVLGREARGVILTSIGEVVARDLLSKKLGNTSVGQMSQHAVRVGSVALRAALAIRATRDVKNLRAYYAH